MKKFLFKSAILALAAPVLLASCSSDSNEPNVPKETPKDFEGIMLSLPNLNTRAEASEDEYAIKDLRVLVYDVSGGSATLKFNKELTGTDVSGIDNADYEPIPIVLGKGTYRMYLVANASGYSLSNDITTLPGSNSPISEDDLKSTKITDLEVIYKSELSGTSRKYLPMACAHSELKESENATTTLGTSDIVIDAANPIKSIYADLTFAVAKVKCTMLNNANSAVQLSTLKLLPFTSTTGLVSAKNDNTVVKADAKAITISNNFFTLSNDGNLTTTTLSDPAGKTWGWQNEWYIAENLYGDNKDAADKTKLNFTFNSDSYNKVRVIGDNDETKGVKRGYVYNIKGTISKKELTLKVSVKPWNYFKNVLNFDDEYED